MKITSLAVAIITSIITSILTLALAEKHIGSLVIDEITVIDYQARSAAKGLSQGTINSISTSMYNRASFRCSGVANSRFELEFTSALNDLGYAITSYECKSENYIVSIISYDELENRQPE